MEGGQFQTGTIKSQMCSAGGDVRTYKVLTAIGLYPRAQPVNNSSVKLDNSGIDQSEKLELVTRLI